MSVRTDSYAQSTSEITTYTVDFTADLPTGGTVTGGTATHIPPSGAATALTASVVSPYVYVTVPALSLTGVHNVDVLATMSDGDKAMVRIVISVVYPTPIAREGMASFITRLRGMANAGLDDYSIANIPYWTDAQLQDVLDAHRLDFYGAELPCITAIEGGLVVYKTYRAPYRNLEGGTVNFLLVDFQGTPAGTADYTADYTTGTVTFTADQAAKQWWLTGRAYDIYAAAADVWRMKAAHASADFDFSTDNHSIKGSQVSIQCLKMADYYEQQAMRASLKTTGGNNILVERSDT